MTPIQTINSSMIANRDQLREASYTANGMVSVDFEDIQIRCYPDGRKFNRRTVFTGIEELAKSISVNGQHEPFKVDILADGTIYLNDGERRWMATNIIRSWSPEWAAKFAKVKVLVNDKNMTDVDRIFQQHNSNNGGEPFPIMDEARSFKELIEGALDGKPLSVGEIAERAGKSPAYVEGRLRLADATEEEIQLMNEGKIKPTTLSLLTGAESDPEKRVKRIKEANSKGVRLKGKNVKNAPGVAVLDGAITDIDDVIDAWNPQGVAKNILLDVQAKLRAVINIIQ